MDEARSGGAGSTSADAAPGTSGATATTTSTTTSHAGTDVQAEGGQQQQQTQEQLQMTEDPRVLGGSGTWLCCVPCYWLRRNNSVHKASLTVATLLVTSLLVASPVLFLISAVPANEQPNKDCFPLDECTYDTDGSVTVCDGMACRAAAARVLSSMNPRVQPCNDFYQFACGGWPRAHAPDDALSLYTMQNNINLQIQNLLSTNASDRPFQKLGQFYSSCLRAKNQPVSMAPMYSLLEELGGYLPPGSLGPLDLTPLLARLLRVNGAPLIDLHLDRDPTDRQRIAIFIEVPRPRASLIAFLMDRGFHEDVYLNARYKRQVAAEASKEFVFMKASAEERRLLHMNEILQGFLPSKMDNLQRTRESQSILLFSSKLNRMLPRTKEMVLQFQRRDSYQPYNMTRLQTDFTFVKWERLFSDVLSVNVTDSDTVYVMSPSYLTSLNDTISKFHKRVIHNALLLLYARDTLHELVNTTSRGGGSWPSFCTRLTTGLFSRAVGALYVRQYPAYYRRSLSDRVQRMLGTLKDTLSERMRAAAWLDSPSRKAALVKLAALKGQFVTSPLLFNLTYVEEMLRDVEIDREDFFNNVVFRFRQLRTVNPESFKDMSTDKSWAYPFIVNAFYEPRDNVIVIPLALLTQPYFREDVPQYMAYATIGNIITHEMLHAFDLTGVAYDERGVLREWMTPEARLGLEARVDCVAKQYMNTFRRQVTFKGTKVDVEFDWNITRNENMADIGGLQTAYQSWRRSIQMQVSTDPRLPGVMRSPKQLFFTTAAQLYCSVYLTPEMYIVSVETDFHSPQPERVNGIMMNSPSFSEAFNCPLGSPMNPHRKCSTW